MKKLTYVILLLLVFLSYQNTSYPVTEAKKKYVYICTGGYSKRYHASPNCRGLNNCRGDIVKVTKGYAEDVGRTPCRICY